uniref:Uncharacterized protein n=1 Tax=Escherichia coli TaxID=562 RepID=A0A7U1E1H2_ECOLX|nr:hypothetical protein [Escherichia coli]
MFLVLMSRQRHGRQYSVVSYGTEAKLLKPGVSRYSRQDVTSPFPTL